MTTRDLIMSAAGGTSAVVPDPYFKNVSLLLSGDGTNGSQNNTFVDSSSNNFTITRNGNTTQGSFSPYGNLWSNYFNGTTDYLRVPQTTGMQFGTGDFTIELWIYISSSGLQVVFDNRSGSNGPYSTLYLNGTTPVYYANTTDAITGSALSVGTWYHWAVSRSGTSTKMFINGSQVGSTYSDSTNYVLPSYTIIGRSSNLTDYSTNGYISNCRVVKGTTLYTSNFTPSTTPLTAVSGTSLLTCQSNRFIDNSSNNFAITVAGNTSVQRFSPFNPTAPYSTSTIGGSGYFDGTGDYLNTPSNSALAFGTGNFTVEAWIYPTATTGTYESIIDSRSSDGSVAGWDLGFASNYVFVYNAGFVLSSSAGSVPYNTWTHVAFVRNGSTITLYINGVSAASTSTSSDFTDSTVAIGANPFAGGQTFLGYIANARLVKGTAVYTTSFAPPTAPLTAITNTSLLCNMTNAGIPDAAMMNDLETVGNAQVSTSVKKYGTGSLAFDGSGDYLYLPSNPNLALGTGDFTVEMWVNASATPSDVGLYESRIADDGNGFTLTAFSSSVIRIYSSGVLIASSGTSYVGTWCHVVVVRYSGTWNLFINGVSQGTSTAARTLANSDCVIGAGRYAGGSTVNKYFTGYIDDLRITKGYARYTANFTPPAQALPTQ